MNMLKTELLLISKSTSLFRLNKKTDLQAYVTVEVICFWP